LIRGKKTMLSFALRRLTNPTSRERLARRLADAERLSAKRLRLITAQLQEIERLSTMNARLAALLLDHRTCSKSVDEGAILDSLIHPDPRMHGATTGEMSTIELPLSTPGEDADGVGLHHERPPLRRRRGPPQRRRAGIQRVLEQGPIERPGDGVGPLLGLAAAG
jgi:hypothetical protein